MATIQKELESTRECLATVQKDLKEMNDWACRLTFIVNELQLLQRGLSPVLQHFGKVLPVPCQRPERDQNSLVD